MIGIEYYFRKATIDDFDFIFDLKKKNFKKYIEEYFEWNEEERKEMYYNTLKNYLGEYNIIVTNNKDIGVFALGIKSEHVLRTYDHGWQKER